MTTRFKELRERRHAQWLLKLKQKLRDVVADGNQKDGNQSSLQVYLFGSRARGDWDGLSDTDLLVVSETKAEAEAWADRLLDAGIAQDVIGMDREAWAQLPNHPSVIWRHVARDAMPLLESGQ